MDRVLKRKQLVDLLAEKTDFYKYNVEKMLDALEDVIMDNMLMAKEGEPSEIRLTLGFTFGAKYRRKQLVKDPRTGEMVVSAARVIPYAKFSPHFRRKLADMTKDRKKEG